LEVRLQMPDREISLLRATTADFDLARQAVTEVNLPTSHQAISLDEAALAGFLTDPKHYLLLAVKECKAVGSLYGYALQHPYRQRPQFFLYGIDVRPEYSNRGIGTALVASFIAEARLASAFEVWVITNEANQAARRIYTRCGLQPAGTGDVVLTLALDADCRST
jgi:ribosomal protein S18 acetylase RimI-like enzyme